jgi:phosphonate transport system substrate-binding protein
LRVAIAAVISPKETLASYDALLRYLERRLDQPIELVQRPTYAEVNDLIRAGGIDLAFVCTYAYVLGRSDGSMELLVVPEVRGQTVYYSYLIVPATSPARSLADLRGKVFAFTDPLSNSGKLVPQYQLAQMGETPETFFQRYIYTYSHDKAIRAVAEGLVDGAAVDSLVYEYMLLKAPELATKVKVIAKSDPYGIPPVVVPPRLSSRLKDGLRNLFLHMDEDPEGRSILQELMIDRFTVIPDSAYESVRSIAAMVSRGK